MRNSPAMPVQRGCAQPFPPICALILLLLLLPLAFFSNADATRLYLTPGGYLEETPSTRTTVKMPVRLDKPREWRKTLSGGMGTGSFGFNIYAQNLSRADVAASVEILLETSGREVLLASWPRGLGVTHGTELFTGSRAGSGVQTKAGDVILLRVSAQETGKYHGYGALYMGGQFPSSIDIPNLTSLHDSDVAILDNQFSSVYDDLDEIRRQQEVIQAQLSLISESLANIEGLLAAYLPPANPESEEPAPPPPSPASEETVKTYPMRFSPQVLTLPVESGLALICSVELDSPEEVALANRESLELTLLHYSIRPNPEYCLGQEPEPESSPILRVCFSAEEVASFFDSGKPETSIFTALLRGVLGDQTPIMAKGILRVVRSPRESVEE